MTSHWVRPALPLKAQATLMCPFEQYAARVWLTSVLAFPVAPSSVTSTHQIYHRLRAALSKTLVDFPLLAGQHENTAEADGKILIRVPDESSAGVQFSQWQCPCGGRYPTYKELKAQHFSTNSLSTFGSDLLHLPEIIHGTEVFRARITFIDGGALLAIGVSHCVADGEASATIQRHWARHAREAGASETLYGSSMPFVCQQARVQLWQTNQNGTIRKTSPYTIVPKSNAGRTPSTLVKLPEHGKSSYIQPPFTSKTSTRSLWYFPPQKLQLLKRLASPPAGGDPDQWISTLDALAAFIWQRSAIARRLSHQGFTHAKCSISMNFRPRLQPPLSPDFLGNAADLTFTQAPAAELEKYASDSTAFHKPLPVLARQIRTAIRSWNTTEHESLTGLICSMPPDKTLSMDSRPTRNPGFILSDLSKPAVYSTDWGHGLGFPESSRLLILDAGIPLSMFFILPRLPNGGLELLCLLEHDVMDRMKADVVFKNFAEFRGD